MRLHYNRSTLVAVATTRLLRLERFSVGPSDVAGRKTTAKKVKKARNLKNPAIPAFWRSSNQSVRTGANIRRPLAGDQSFSHQSFGALLSSRNARPAWRRLETRRRWSRKSREESMPLKGGEVLLLATHRVVPVDAVE